MTRVEKVENVSLVEDDIDAYGDAIDSSSKVDEFIKPPSDFSSSVVTNVDVVSAEEMMEEEAAVVDRAAMSIEHEVEEEEEVVLTEAEEDFLQELQASTTFNADDFLR